MSQDVNPEKVREMLERLGENPELRLMNGDLWLMYGEPTPEDIQRGEQDPVSYGWLPSDVYLTGPARDAERVDSEELLDLVLRSPDLARAYLALHARAEALEAERADPSRWLVVGDRVRVVKPHLVPESRKGQMATVVELLSTGKVRIEFADGAWEGAVLSELELLNLAQPGADAGEGQG